MNEPTSNVTLTRPYLHRSACDDFVFFFSLSSLQIQLHLSLQLFKSISLFSAAHQTDDLWPSHARNELSYYATSCQSPYILFSSIPTIYISITIEPERRQQQLFFSFNQQRASEIKYMRRSAAKHKGTILVSFLLLPLSQLHFPFLQGFE